MKMGHYQFLSHRQRLLASAFQNKGTANSNCTTGTPNYIVRHIRSPAQPSLSGFNANAFKTLQSLWSKRIAHRYQLVQSDLQMIYL